MKDKIQAMFQEVTMPDSCEGKIRQAAGKRMLEKRGRKERRFRPAAILGALALVVLLSPPVRAAVESAVERLFFPGTGLSIVTRTDQYGRFTEEVHYDTESPSFAELRDGKLYFTAEGKTLDITDMVTEGEPFLYSYEDGERQVTVYMAVGYAGSLENFGTYVFLWEWGETPESQGSWGTGAGRNFLDPETDQVYPWVKTIWEALLIPWDMPGKEPEHYSVQIAEDPTGEPERIEVEKVG